MKAKKVFICSNCGHKNSKWEGKCSVCSEWNTFIEEIITKPSSTEKKRSDWHLEKNKDLLPVLIQNVEQNNLYRIPIKDLEFHRTLGGGLVPGSITLIGGDPGIGKSTLLLQLALKSNFPILYVSGEESVEQIKMRADRIGIENQDCHILTETNLNKVLITAQKLKPNLVVIDSIQTIISPLIESAPGSISQVRECTTDLQQFAKESNIPVVIIGHINKEGSIAGPKILEHIVDTVLQFEGDRNHIYRILRTKKNRFGSTDEMGIYAMESTGLRQVQNPSELLLSQSDESLSGSSVAVTIEGLRPMLIETQALVSQAIYGTPQRSATGFDLRRLSMLLAVLEKRAGLFFGQNDVFLNMAGGLKVTDTAIDLAIASALISSLQNIPVNSKICFTGEIGLTGEIRAVNRIEQRIEEASRLGFEEIFVSKYNLKGLKVKDLNIRITGLGKVEDLLSEVFS
ncbi:MAG: DNA repair protein RadA [Saprospiraceae bacterium]|nr:DNA repair protein RadA [Saprospiraceae bacterium]NNL93814.1 DNA repair protein RadA [Saprospiraceae bacterium]